MSVGQVAPARVREPRGVGALYAGNARSVVGRGLLATKSIEWAYEREWRLINFERSHAAVALPDGMEMTALIAGIRMTSDAFAQFRATARRLGIPAYRVEASSSYRMTLQPLSEAASGLDADR